MRIEDNLTELQNSFLKQANIDFYAAVLKQISDQGLSVEYIKKDGSLFLVQGIPFIFFRDTNENATKIKIVTSREENFISDYHYEIIMRYLLENRPVQHYYLTVSELVSFVKTFLDKNPQFSSQKLDNAHDKTHIFDWYKFNENYNINDDLDMISSLNYKFVKEADEKFRQALMQEFKNEGMKVELIDKDPLLIVVNDVPVSVKINSENMSAYATIEWFGISDKIKLSKMQKKILREYVNQLSDGMSDNFRKISQVIEWINVFLENNPAYYNKKLSKIHDKTNIFEMKNLQNWSKFNENFPPGAEYDSRAPYNQKSVNEDMTEFDGVLLTEDEEEVPVHVKFWYYYETPESIRKQITSYEYKITGDESKLNKDYIDEDVRSLIVEEIGDRHYDWQC